MIIKFKTLLYLVLATSILFGYSVTVFAKNPQSCADGVSYLGSTEYQKSIRKLSECLRSSSLSSESRAIFLYNRAVSHFFLYEDKVNKHEEAFEQVNKILTKAYKDIEKSIGLDPIGTPKAYCLRGWIYLEESWGIVGYDDLDKGITMGAPKHLCDYSDY